MTRPIAHFYTSKPTHSRPCKCYAYLLSCQFLIAKPNTKHQEIWPNANLIKSHNTTYFFSVAFTFEFHKCQATNAQLKVLYQVVTLSHLAHTHTNATPSKVTRPTARFCNTNPTHSHLLTCLAFIPNIYMHINSFNHPKLIHANRLFDCAKLLLRKPFPNSSVHNRNRFRYSHLQIYN